MADVVAIILGVALVLAAFTDLINTLVTTSTVKGRWWLSRIVARWLLAAIRFVAQRLPETSNARERMLSGLGPLLILILLAIWIVQQILGFALIWWAIDGVEGVSSLADSIYYSGVVYFTVGFGEVLPSDAGPRVGALIEAGCGVVTTALVVGYLPSLYSAYSEREKKLMTIDDGSDDRITPTDLVIAWSPNADTDRLNAKLADWEEWVASIHETHSTLPMLVFFRSHDRRQNWVTALGLLADTAVQAQIIVQCTGRTESYWLLRRIISLFEEFTQETDLSSYAEMHTFVPGKIDDTSQFDDLYVRLEAHGFDLLPMDVALRRAAAFRNRFAPPMEHLIDALLCPRGFWSPALNIEMYGTEFLDGRTVDSATQDKGPKT
jgi:hypothetical protein